MSSLQRKQLRRLVHFLSIFVLIFSLISPAVSAREISRNVEPGLNIEESLAQKKKLVEHQINALNNEEVLHPSLEKSSDDEWIEVIVQLSEEPVALARGKREV